MKTLLVGITLLLLCHSLAAFPSFGSISSLFSNNPRRAATTTSTTSTSSSSGGTPAPSPALSCTAPSWYKIDPTRFKYQAPTATDKRGPCPALNAFANHGYLPRNGIATVEDIKNLGGCIASFGTSAVAFFIVGAFTSAGDLLGNRLSIGGPLGGGVLQQNPGLNCHCGIECDTSLTRADYYFGNNHDFNLTLWRQLVQTANAHPNPWSLKMFSDVRLARYQQSAATNPILVYGPRQFITMSGTSFAANFMFSNLGADGKVVPTTETMRTWFQNERVPDNLKQRPDPLTFGDLLNTAFYNYWDHPVNFVNTTMAFPTRKECMKCYYRALMEENLPLNNLYLVNFIYTEFLTPYCKCEVPNCGY